jgi:acetyl-CoA carboxylase biotin carboxyl carrier protein
MEARNENRRHCTVIRKCIHISELSIKSENEKVIIKNDTDDKVVDTVRVVTEKTEGESKNKSDEENIIKSPLVGRFYAAPSVGSDNYVKVGDKVEEGTLAIIEAMKLMNEIKSEYSGTVKSILVENEELVEYGQPLFVLV